MDLLRFRNAKGKPAATDAQDDGAAEWSPSQDHAFGTGDEPHIHETSSDFSASGNGIDHEREAVADLVEGHVDEVVVGAVLDGLARPIRAFNYN